MARAAAGRRGTLRVNFFREVLLDNFADHYTSSTIIGNIGYYTVLYHRGDGGYHTTRYTIMYQRDTVLELVYTVILYTEYDTSTGAGTTYRTSTVKRHRVGAVLSTVV